MENIPINKIQQSGLITLDLQRYAPDIEYVSFDLKDYLFMELILKEKDFRAALKELDLSSFSEKTVLVYCSTDVIIPMWAYMLVVTKLREVSGPVFAISPSAFLEMLWIRAIDAIDISGWESQKVIIKGCSDIEVPPAAYAQIAWRLLPTVQSLMFGEPCSTVPVYKKKTALSTL